MARLETFCTSGLAPRRRLEFWNDLTCSTFTPIVADPLDLDAFRPSLSKATVGEVLLSEVHSSPSIVRHTPEHVARTQQAMFFLHAQLEGRSAHRQDGREARLEPGEFTLFDNRRPYQMTFEEPNTVLVVGIPDRLMHRHLANPEGVVALPMRRGDPLVGLFTDFLQRLWALTSSDAAPMNHGVGNALASLAGGAYSAVPQARADAASLTECRRVRLVRYVEDHLGEADLGPVKIAAVFRTTPRNLHLLFSRGGETLCRYILRRRIEECARILADRAHLARTISDVAFDLGFSSLTHFGKVFHDQFGMSPSEYRNVHARVSAAAEEPMPATLRRRKVAC
ncbi:MAG: helix-turn-helix domain-containing protein [Steroidobacteraceae bacterium]